MPARHGPPVSGGGPLVHPAARRLAESVEGAELFLYGGDPHVLTDRSLADYDEAAATVVMRRVLGFLDDVR